MPILSIRVIQFEGLEIWVCKKDYELLSFYQVEICVFCSVWKEDHGTESRRKGRKHY